MTRTIDGVEHKDAYIRIERSLSKKGKPHRIATATYVNATDTSDTQALDRDVYWMEYVDSDPNMAANSNFTATLYKYLKTLPEFSGAIDI